MFNLKKSIIACSIIIFSLLIFTGVFAQDGMHKHNMSKSNKEMNMPKSTLAKSSEAKKSEDPIVREGVIDLKKIDTNKDGKVYQDMMDYNVISDKPGKCPLCGMTLKQVTLKEAKTNLTENGFKVK